MTDDVTTWLSKPVLRALFRIFKSEAVLVKTAVLKADGVSLVLPLLDDSDPEIRETAINLLFLFSHHEPQGVVEYLLKPKRLEALVTFLQNDEKSDVQMAAAGLLANLPKSELPLTMKLIELEGLDAIIKILRSGTMEAKENALSALFRVDSLTAKARAAALIGTLSNKHSEAHCCDKIKKLLVFLPLPCPSMPSSWSNSDSPQKGVNVLHEADAIKPTLEILTWGTDSLKEEALGLLEKVFMSRDMVEIYGLTARLLLVGLTGRNIHDDGCLGRKATRILSLIERYSRSSTSLLPGLFGQTQRAVLPSRCVRVFSIIHAPVLQRRKCLRILSFPYRGNLSFS
ncbi:hypothetical protein Patl1_25261 [Pistacia atlantica]|uniref:Uncharacterized protein n=1 Tax=Pistacia atlantica TaxID=434234 RepID=A0ACC1B323_9ROSI|nr:hypothetical protein Patl1_25261 [Pistacia atlantica]